MMTEKKIAITIGDPGGIGPEITLKAIAELQEKHPKFHPIIIGSKKALEHPNLATLWKTLSEKTKRIDFIDCPLSGTLEEGKETAENGKASIDYIMTALKLIKEKKASALVTAPINKKSLSLAKSPYTGHTTLLAKETNSKDVSMGFYSKTLKTVLTTIHIPFRDVPEQLTENNLRKALNNSLEFATILKIEDPKIALSGLNPHAGESGLFGNEESSILRPFIEKMQALDYPIFGPFPADSLYRQAMDGDFDIVISLYHDQGLIPMKLLGFGESVNITLGLPFIRTSPDHGTAFDIAYKDKANPKAMAHAISLAIALSQEKK